MELHDGGTGVTHCTMCGRNLKNFRSIQAGMGPLCRSKIPNRPRMSRDGRIRSRYKKVKSDRQMLVIKDLGPWDTYPSVTNDAEGVVQDLLEELGKRKLYYFDSENNLDQILVKRGRFAGFRPGDIIIDLDEEVA